MGTPEVVGGVPVHARIADDLRSAIRSGELKDGDRLPGENALMERYGVARMTARQALATLRYEGLAVSRKGSGVFVRLFKPIRRHGSRRLARSLWGEGGNIWGSGFEDHAVTVDHIKIERIEANEELAELFGSPEGMPLLRRSRRYVVDDRYDEPARRTWGSSGIRRSLRSALASDQSCASGIFVSGCCADSGNGWPG